MYICYSLTLIAEILVTHLGESWTRHLCLGLTILKKALMGLMTFWLGLLNILSYKDICHRMLLDGSKDI
jgi:uncharacterized integral membrane protein